MSQGDDANPKSPTPTPAGVPGGGLPSGGVVSEEQLVDLIDGVLGDDQAKALIERAGRSDLLVRVHEMRRQRELLASLPEVQAPAELHDRVLAALEREALVGISNGVSAGPPTSKLRLTGNGPASAPTKRLLIHRAPGLALAAGLALLVVGGAYFGSQAWRGTPPIAPHDTGTASGTLATRADNAGTHNTTPAPIEQGSTMAKAASTDHGGSAVGDTLAGSGSASRGMIAQADAREEGVSPYAKQTVTLERALELAAEGRLAIRVTPSTLRGLGEIERAGEKRTGERQWRLSKAVPPAVLAAALPALDDRKPRMGPPRPDEGIIMAAALVRPMVGPGAAYSFLPTTFETPRDASPQGKLHASYIADLPRSERAFDILRMVFREKLKGEVRFVELPEGVTTPSLREADDEIWWEKPPVQWAPRVSVPVLVERVGGGA